MPGVRAAEWRKRPSSPELPDQRQDFLLEYLHRDGTDAFVANDSIAVDHIGFRHAIDAIVDAHATVAVLYGQGIRVAMLAQPAQCILALVLVIESIDRQHVLLREVNQDRMLFQAGHAPGGPYIEDPDFPLEVFGAEHLAGLLQLRQPECGRRLSDQRRRHFARVQAEPDREKDGEHQEDAQRKKAFHRSVTIVTPSRSSRPLRARRAWPTYSAYRKWPECRRAP